MPPAGGAARAPAAGRPLDLTKIVVAGELAAAAVAVARQLARRQPAPCANVRMGPGGWVSLRGGNVRIRERRLRAEGRFRLLPATWARRERPHRVARPHRTAQWR